MLKKYAIVLIILFGIFISGALVHAGFGISPPYVKTTKPLFAGTHYEQKITLLRSSAEEELQAKIEIKAPEVASWISINKGELFDLPKNKLQVPMIVMVDVPDDAVVGNYKGHINIRIMPKKNETGSGVAIALGARIDIDLSVTDETFIDFEVRKVDIPDFEKLTKPWEWPIFSWFFYRVKVVMKLKNIGNVKIAPSKVQLDVYDLAENELLESLVDKKFKEIEPFTTGETVATFPTKLPPGQYWGRVNIFRDKDIVYNNKSTFTIYAPGQMPGGYKIGRWAYIMLSAWLFLILLIILILIKLRVWRYIFKGLYILSWPLRMAWRIIRSVLHKFKIKFWQWMHKKSAAYQKVEDDGSSNSRNNDKRDEIVVNLSDKNKPEK